MGKPLTKQELHNLAMNHVGQDLEQRGFEFIAVNSRCQGIVCRGRVSKYRR